MAETLRAAEEEIERLRPPRDHHLPAARRGGGGHALRARGGRRYAALVALIARAPRARRSSPTDGSRVDDQVAALLAGRRIATAESCTAGLVAARLTERPGSSAYFAGGVVAYANEAKAELLGRGPALIERHGAVSPRGGGGDGGGRAVALRADTGGGDHRRRRARRRNRGEARGHGVLRVRAADGRRDHPRRAPAGRPGGHPRPLDHRGDAPAAPVPARRGERA